MFHIFVTEMDFRFCGPKISTRIEVVQVFDILFQYSKSTGNMHINKVMKLDNVYMMELSPFQ